MGVKFGIRLLFGRHVFLATQKIGFFYGKAKFFREFITGNFNNMTIYNFFRTLKK